MRQGDTQKTPMTFEDDITLTPGALPGSPTAGDVKIDSGATNTLKWYDGTTWQSAGGGGGGAPVDAQYLTLAANATLTVERIFTPSLPLVGTDGGAGLSYGLSINAATELAVGVAEIATQAEATTGTDDARYITPLKLATRLATIDVTKVSELWESDGGAVVVDVDATGNVVFNDASVVSRNWRMESNNNANMFNLLGDSDVVIIGGATQQQAGSAFEVQGTGGTTYSVIHNGGDTTAQRDITLQLRHSNGAGAQITAYRDSGASNGATLMLSTETTGGILTPRIYITPAGLVGIGASAAVSGTGIFFDPATTSQPRFTLANGSSSVDHLIDYTVGAAQAAITRIYRITNTSGSKHWEWYKGDNSATVHARIAVDGANSFFNVGGGVVGIGTSVPTLTAGTGLHIKGVGTHGVLRVDSGTSGTSAIIYHGINGTDKWHYSVNSAFKWSLVETGVADNRIAAIPGGNIGIGTAPDTTSGALLQVMNSTSGFRPIFLTGVGAVAQTIVPNGTPDASVYCILLVIVSDASGSPFGTTLFIANGGSAGVSTATSTYTFTVAASGAVTVIRTAGAGSATITGIALYH